MLNEIIVNHFANNQKLSLEHRDSLYPVFASCEVEPSKKYYFKKVVGKCLRAAYLDCIGYGTSDKEVGNLGRKISQKLGDASERAVLNLLSDANVLIDKNIKFKIEDLFISGKLDGIVNLFNKEYGLEIKSLSSNQFTINQIFGSPWNSNPSPKIDHVLQVIPYLYAFRDRLDKFILYYIRRDNGDVKEFMVEFAAFENDMIIVIDGIPNYDITLNKVIGRFKALKTFIDSNVIPPPDFIAEYSKKDIEFLKVNGCLSQKRYDLLSSIGGCDFECTNCSYRALCK